ncbi:serine hydrolase domain-containing protein [Cellulomonas cellasea]|uniref:Beta-lactamase n=2 Tax=Cellulomonas cellasea TaxID=43670 RepID=A0A0A0B397_9CELL|nr:serine hydrolase domain-containing protein [Cellulomonas cellasea]KGM01305.1 beta-lactamase [Cellulomonas cellasea DSM 20118]GEA87372.1 serine hydrolase [Cellulomonas cellasea]
MTTRPEPRTDHPLPDDALADRVRRLLGRRHPVVGVAAVTPGGTSTALLGAAPDADLEIGSVSKGVTGLLYVDALDRGEVSASTTLGDHLDLGGSAVGAVRLADLATHRSGLPRLAPGTHVLRRSVALWRHGTNPYGETLDELLDSVRPVVPGAPRPRYSNLGFALLGHAVAAAAGTSYPDLLRTRVAEPLALDPFYVARTPDELRPEALLGRSRRGKAQEAWTGEGIAPAGGIRSSLDAAARLTAALLDGSAPGLRALDPVAPLGRGAQVGAAWVTLDMRGRTVTWHNGGTGGFRSWLGLDRAAGTGVVVIAATAVSVDRAGFALLAELATPADRA